MNAKITQILHKVTIFCIILSVVVLIVQVINPSVKIQVHNQVELLTLKGTYQIDDGPLHEFAGADNTGDVLIKQGQTLTLRGHFDRDIRMDEPLSVYVGEASATIYVNDTKINANGRYREGTNYVSYYTHGISASDNVVIYLENNQEEPALLLNFLINLSCGADFGHFYYQIRDNFASIIMSAITMFIGIVLLACTVISKRAKSNHTMQLLCLTGYVISCAVWFSTDESFFTAIVPYPFLMNALQLMSLCYIPITALRYAESEIGKEKSGTSLKINILILEFILLGYFGCILFNKYSQHLLLICFTVIMIISLLHALRCLYREAREHKTKGVKLVFTLLILVFSGMVLDAVYYSLHIKIPSNLFQGIFFIGLIILLYYVIRYIFQSIKNAQRAAELENELLQSKISIMLSQIKPHFMFNTLNAISALCMRDPLKADEVIVKFSDYLRENINSLETPVPIPFEKELQHVKNYADIEQIRFQNKLTVEYDIQFTDFKMPTLTLQPIVENSIRHGIGKKQGSGTVWIRCVREDDYACIVVRDDGVGFDMSGDYKREDSIGMENIKTRLEGTIHATIEISSTVGVGTQTMIKVPLSTRKDT